MTLSVDQGGLFVKTRFTSPLFELAKEVRMEVFVVEQKVPAENELDEIDVFAIHWIALVPAADMNKDLKSIKWRVVDEHHVLASGDIKQWYPVATLRLFDSARANGTQVKSGDPVVYKLGRMAVRMPYRGSGIASKLMSSAEMELPQSAGLSHQGVKLVLKLHAQQDKEGFYSKNGYEVCDGGKVFWEENIPHVMMKKYLAAHE